MLVGRWQVTIIRAGQHTWGHAALRKICQRGGPAQCPVLCCIICSDTSSAIRGHGTRGLSPYGVHHGVQCMLKAQGVAQLVK